VRMLARLLIAPLLMIGSVGQVLGRVVVIQPPPLASSAGTWQIAAVSPFGQTFLAPAPSIDSIGLVLINYNLQPAQLPDRLVTLRLFEGEGLEGQQIAKRTVDVASLLGDQLNAQSLVDFEFDNVAVSVGQTYSFSVDVATERFGTYMMYGSAYPAGFAIFDSSPTTLDVYFNLTTSAVPAPSRSELLMLGLVGIALRRVAVRNTQA